MRSGWPGTGPRPKVVVGHQVIPIQVLHRATVVRRIHLAARRAIGGYGRSDQIGAEAATQGRHESWIGTEATGIAAQAARIWIFPINVNAGEGAVPARIVYQVVAG